MTSRERVMGAFYKKGYDRIPVKHEGTPEINKMIMDHFGLKNMEQLLRVVGDDINTLNSKEVSTWKPTFCHLPMCIKPRTSTGHIFLQPTGLITQQSKINASGFVSRD
jgi:hypothetical protein